MTVALIVIAVIVVLALIYLASRRQIDSRRRDAAAGLRREAFDRDEKAQEAEITAREQRELAEARRARADRIDPDTETDSQTADTEEAPR